MKIIKELQKYILSPEKHREKERINKLGLSRLIQ